LSEKNIIISNENEETINIPIKRNDFGRFVSDLLGQPEIIVFNKSGHFTVDFSWLKHIHHLLNQRITQQSNCDLVDFSARFDFTSGGSRKLTSVNTFLNFNEAKIVRTESIKIIWTYLISFPNKKTPEKQEIELYLANGDIQEEEGFIIKFFGRSYVSLKIRHTERTWGDDLFTILEREVNTIFEKKPSYKKTKKAIMIISSFIFILIGFLLPDYMQDIIREKELANIYTQFMPNGLNIQDMDMNNKINFIIRLLDPINKIYQVPEIYRIISIIFGAILSFFTIYFFSQSKKSFILITKEDIDDKNEYDKKNKQSIFINVISYVFAISAGILANYAYYYLTISK
jgi:hypothetical protein